MSLLALSLAEHSVLLVVDIQQRLAQAMPAETKDKLLKNAGILLTAANYLDVPVIVTEQYPKGLGSTEAVLQQKLTQSTPVIEKTAFSAAQIVAVEQQLKKLARKQIILLGIEAHICVVQTAVDLLRQGYEVFIVADAVCCREEHNYHNALHRLTGAGAVISNTESVVFEWLGDASHPQFKTLSRLIS